MIWTGAERDLDQVTSTAPDRRPVGHSAADVPRDEAPGVLDRGDVPGILPDPGAPPRADAVVAGS
jgi:hypothetical protein